MLARSLGQSYGNNWCLGQNTFSDTLGGFGCRHHALKIHENLRVFFPPTPVGETCPHVWANIRAVYFPRLTLSCPSSIAAGDRMNDIYSGTLGPERITKGT